MKRLISLHLIIVFISISSCTNVIDEPAGSAVYYLNNETDYVLNVEFMTTWELGFKVDSSNIVSSNTKVKLLEDAMFGVNPEPSHSFKSIRLYTFINNSKKPVFEMDPIIDERWSIIEQNIGKSGYGNTAYQLIVENSDLDIN
jgi:hypothetical protein